MEVIWVDEYFGRADLISFIFMQRRALLRILSIILSAMTVGSWKVLYRDGRS